LKYEALESVKLWDPLKESAYTQQLFWAPLKARYFAHYICYCGPNWMRRTHTVQLLLWSLWRQRTNAMQFLFSGGHPSKAEHLHITVLLGPPLKPE